MGDRVNKSMVVLLCTSYCIHVSARPPKLDALVGLPLHGRRKVLLVLLLQAKVLKTYSLVLLLYRRKQEMWQDHR